MNDECRNPNDEAPRVGPLPIRHSGFVIDSSFGLRHSSLSSQSPSPQPSPLGTGERGQEGVEAPAAADGQRVSLKLEQVHKRFGECRAVDGVSLDVREGELLAILGPSGCGKSTLLRLVAGLERQDGGRVVLHGRDVGKLPPAARGCGVVFQSYALFPNLTAAQNV